MREIVDFDDNWLFHRGDVVERGEYPSYKGISYMGAKTERMLFGPASRYYNDNPDCYERNVEYKIEKWERVSVPHDYIVGDEPKEKNNTALGFFEYENAWYRKKFRLSTADEGKRITLYFEGIATNATIYLNGCLLKHNFCGYTPFEVDVSDYVEWDKENVLAVYVSTENHEGWWYEGAGIYRHVKLIKTDLLSVDRWGVYVKPQKTGEGQWTVPTEVCVRNDGDKAKKAVITARIVDKEGNEVALARATGIVPCREKKTFSLNFTVEKPLLWSPESPNLYTMQTTVSAGGRERDEDKTRFGFRSFRMDADEGLFINDKHYKIKGVCAHADCGLLGKAVPDNVHRYKVSLIKQMGANGYRTSHYPHAEAVMDALDENGFIVMDETRWFESSDEGIEQLTTLIKRDRNRPSVFFWSLGNEEKIFSSQWGRRIFKTMAAAVRKLDDSRPIMAACDVPADAKIFDLMDVVAINYCWDKIDDVRKAYPDKPFLSSECCASGTTRGWYAEKDEKKQFLPAWDSDTGNYFANRERTWSFITQRQWLMGGYQWIAFEHRGEAIWPRLCSVSGAIDLYLQKKDAFYQNKSHWSDEPMVHLLPHWNFGGFEGKKIKVIAYTNCDSVELFVNGKSAGEQVIQKPGKGAWEVEYAPGYIEAVGYVAGQAVVRDKRETTGKPVALKLIEDTQDVRANGKDVAIFSCCCVDEKGREVPDAQPTVDFSATGAGTVYSTGSDITDHTSLLCEKRKMRAGRIGIAVKMKAHGGTLTLTARADGLDSAVFIKRYDE